MPRLGVNIDHVATIRQARRTYEPDPVWAAVQAELGGADGITVHLREDRRHIQERDVQLLRRTVHVPLNLEMAAADEIVEIACRVRPDQATLVPERREEVTTEGGLDAISGRAKIARAIERLRGAGILVSLFLAPDEGQIGTARDLGADAVELHTGGYAEACLLPDARRRREETSARLAELARAAARTRSLGMVVHAGHGLTYTNVAPVAKIKGLADLNIGHSIVARAVFAGLERAVREMKALVSQETPPVPKPPREASVRPSDPFLRIPPIG